MRYGDINVDGTNPVIEELLAIVEADPLPAEHTSSHWQLRGGRITVQRTGGRLVLQAYGFGRVDRKWGFLGRRVQSLERLTYWNVTSPLKSYPPVWRMARRLAADLKFDLTFDVWRQAVALSVLTDHWAAYGLSHQTFALIGDGYGFLGALIRRQFPESRVYSIDLPKILIFQARTHQLANPHDTLLVGGKETGDVVMVQPDEVESIPVGIDCAVNIASMQEMTSASIESYFTFLRRRSTSRSRFYCVNRSHKALVGGEVTNFEKYPWQSDDEVFIDARCPYISHVLARRTSGNGPRVLGVRVPFVNYLGGTQMHRLVHLAPAAQIQECP